MKTAILCFLILITAVTMSVAHGGKKHKKYSSKTHADSTAIIGEEHEHPSGDADHHHREGISDKSKISADLDDFPTLHPLIVHFAIVLIIVAAGLQLINLWLVKREISWIITSLLFLGVLTAWLAATNFHPHTRDLSMHAQLVLDQHDIWAARTINFGIVGLLLQITNLFFFKAKRWAFAIVAAVLMLTGYCVAHASHYGSQLVHIEGIGPQGNYLETGHHH